MTDQEARNDILIQQITTKKPQEQIDFLSGELTVLRKAFDALFDVVAADLGYKAAAEPNLCSGGIVFWSEVSPREFAKTTPQAELVRKPARFKKD